MSEYNAFLALDIPSESVVLRTSRRIDRFLDVARYATDTTFYCLNLSDILPIGAVLEVDYDAN